jgi:pyruvate, water dikinase
VTGTSFTRRLTEVSAADRAWAGGKAASLGELARSGLAVPPGYVVTTEAFGCAMAGLDPSGALAREIEELDADDAGAIGEAAAHVRDRIKTAPLPPEVAARIAASHADLAADLVAVRSSATMEDSADASFAGLQDSYLAVRGLPAVLDRVRSCWASLYNRESVAYRRRAGLAERGLAMGVVVQRMVSPRAAGVMFTRSPVTGDRSVVAIEATWGLGSAVVAGEVTPDNFTVSKVTGEITGRRIGAKLRLHSFDHNVAGITAQDTPADLAGRPCLTDDEARELARLARQVEDHYGTAQDIEWALLADDGAPPGPAERIVGRIVLLQSRQETVWAARDAGPLAAPKARACDHVLGLFGTASRWS